MNRPKVTSDMVREAAKDIAARIGGNVDDIAKHYRHPMDGYELARALDRYASWDLTMSDVEVLDELIDEVSSLQREAEKKWAKENDIKPPLPVGTRIKQGVIDSVCMHIAATYRVKEYGCTQVGRYRLIRFEDAVAA